MIEAVGDYIYVTRVAYESIEAIKRNCAPLLVRKVTRKAVLLECENETQWFPISVMKPASTVPGIYLIPRWMDLTDNWQTRTGRPRPASKSPTQ